ncbi:MAG TPA: APC family permease [Acidobacteriaceae bacterium]|nr:APC family permease [Acidobacteriaceae bacterium]
MKKLPKLRLIPLIAATFFMVSGGPYGIEDILGGAGYGRALVILVVLPLIWTLPTTLMIGELASALPQEGGFYVWVRRALGPFWGYQEAWLSLAASIFDMALYPSIFVLYLGKLAPAWTTGARAGLWSFAIVAACCLWNLRGAREVGDGSLVLSVLLLAPFVWLTAAGLWHGLAVPAAHRGPSADPDLSAAILVAMWNYMGWDNASTVAQEVENPQRNYPLAMFGSALVVMLSYILPLAAIAMAGISVDRFSTGSWTDAGRLLGGPVLGIAIVVGGIINGFAMFNALVLSYTRLPMVLAEDGMLPQWVARRNRHGAPWVAILLCGAGWAMALHFSFERLISMDLILYGSSLILEFVALAVLRHKEPSLPRPFSAGKGLLSACLIGLGPAGLILYAIYSARGERMAHLPALLFGAIVIALGPLLYRLSKAGEQPEALLAAAGEEGE